MIRGFWKAAQEEPDRIAIIDADGSEVTAGNLLTHANQLVHGLRFLGFKEGDCLAVMLPNSAALLEVMAANMQAGWHIVPINHHSTAEEVAYILKDSGAKAFISHKEFAENSIDALKYCNTDKNHNKLDGDLCFSIDGSIEGFKDYEDFIKNQPSTLPENRIAGGFMQYTSGTTGKPKGVQRDIYQIEPEIMMDYMSINLTRFDIEPGNNNVFLCPSPMYHTAPLAYSFFSLCFEHKIIILEKWDAESFLSLIEKYKVTTSLMVPTHFNRLLLLPEATQQKYDISSLCNVLHGAAPCPKDTKQKMFAWWGEVIYEYYGATEGGGALAKPKDWLRFPGTVGKAWEGAEIRIYQDDDNLGDDGSDNKAEPKVLAAREVGIVYMKLSQDFTYKGDTKKTHDNRIGDFFTVGDIGYLNEEGFLFLCDRKIDMIISGGVNIYPAEIEAVLLSHPLVADAAVFGIPNKDFGEEVKAVIEPKEWIESGDDLVAQLLVFCKEKLSKYKCPRSIDFTQALPRDPNGKLYKRKLRNPYWKK